MPYRALAIYTILLVLNANALHCQRLPSPKITPDPGEVRCPVTIVITPTTPGTVLWATSDGQDPLTDMFSGGLDSANFTSAFLTIPIDKTATIRAVEILPANRARHVPKRVSLETRNTYICTAAIAPQPPAPPAVRVPSRFRVILAELVRSHALLAWLAAAAIVILLIATLFAGSYLRVRRYVSKPDVGVGRQLSPVTRAAAERAILGRRQGLRDYFERLPDSRGEVREFIESPPGISDSAGLFFGPEPYDAAWHTARLRLQLDDDKLLLLERVTDALVCYHRIGSIRNDEFPVRIYLKVNRDFRAWDTARAVVVSTNPGAISDLLLPIAEWLGIEVEIAEPLKAKTSSTDNRPDDMEPPAVTAVATGRCTIDGSGLEGTVGGMITSEMGAALGVTCRHVLSTNCGSLDPSCNPFQPSSQSAQFTLETPDVAFIRLGQSCFTSPHAPSFLVSPCDQSFIEAAIQMRTVVRKSSRGDKAQGIVRLAEMSGFKLGDHFYRGIYFTVVPHLTRRFGIIWSLSKSFSKPGDSGSWIVQGSSWLGIVIGGFENPAMTIALSAAQIDSFFAALHTTFRATTISAGAVQFRAFD